MMHHLAHPRSPRFVRFLLAVFVGGHTLTLAACGEEKRSGRAAKGGRDVDLDGLGEAPPSRMKDNAKSDNRPDDRMIQDLRFAPLPSDPNR